MAYGSHDLSMVHYMGSTWAAYGSHDSMVHCMGSIVSQEKELFGWLHTCDGHDTMLSNIFTTTVQDLLARDLFLCCTMTLQFSLVFHFD